MKEIVTIRISTFLSNDLAARIAELKWGSNTPDSVNRIRQGLFDEIKNGNQCFEVIAAVPNDRVIGRIHCIRTTDDPLLWYYGDLFVHPEYRRRGVASSLVNEAKKHLSEIGAVRLRCYVDPNNVASIALQRKLRFEPKPFERFNLLTNDGEMMFECALRCDLSVICATESESYFCRMLFVPNRESLGGANIRLSDWKEMLRQNAPDKNRFLVCKGAVPIAFFQMSGEDGASEAVIDTVFVLPQFKRQGVGTFALHFAETFCKERGARCLTAKVAQDNGGMRNLMQKLGYAETDSASSARIYKKQL